MYHLPIAFSIILLLAFFVLSFAKPVYGLVCVIVFLPFERLGSYALNPVTGHPVIHPSDLAAISLIGAFVLLLILGKEKIDRRLNPLPFIIFGASVLISAIITRGSLVWGVSFWFIFVLILSWVTAQIVAKYGLKPLLPAIFLSAAGVSLFGIYQYLGDTADLPASMTGIAPSYAKEVLGFTRLQSTAREPLFFANYLLTPIFLALAFVFSTKTKKLWAGAFLALMLIALFLTTSRGALLSALTAFVLFVIYTRKTLSQKLRGNGRMLGLISGIFVLVFALLIGLSSLQSRGSILSGPRYVASFFTTKLLHTGSYTDRVENQKAAIDVFRSHPVTGVGFGGYGPYLNHDKTSPLQVNNLFFQLLAEGGLLGLISFGALWAYIFSLAHRRLLKESDQTSKLYVAGLIAAVVAITLQSLSFSGYMCCLLHPWISLGLLAGIALTPVTFAQIKKERKAK